MAKRLMNASMLLIIVKIDFITSSKLRGRVGAENNKTGNENDFIS